MLSTGVQNMKSFYILKDWGFFLLVIQVQVESYSLDILEKRTRFYETVEVDVDSESKLLFLKLLRDWNRRNIWNQETNILLWRQHFIKFQRNSLKSWWLAVFFADIQVVNIVFVSCPVGRICAVILFDIREEGKWSFVIISYS